jgi:catechol 2,3-dioxygenase-like lactoylglutathione lyase family enzyme
MTDRFDTLLDQYDRGVIGRRALLGGMLALAAPAMATAAETPKAIKPGLNLNHVHLYISDLDKEIKFYKDLLGAEVHDTSPGNATMHLPGKPSWISLTVTKEKPYINHVGYGADFDQKGGDAQKVAEAINKMYPTAKARPTGPTVHGANTRSVYLYDPDGIYLQIVPKNDDGWLPTGPIGSKILKGAR